MACPLWGSNSSLLRVALLGRLARSGVYSKIVSQHFLLVVGFFLFARCVGVTQLSIFFPEEVVPYVAVYLVCLYEEVSPGPFYLSIFNISNTYFLNVAKKHVNSSVECHVILHLLQSLISSCPFSPSNFSIQLTSFTKQHFSHTHMIPERKAAIERISNHEEKFSG